MENTLLCFRISLNSPEVQTSRGSPPASLRRTSWRCTQSRRGCVSGGHTAWRSRVCPHTFGRSSWRSCPGSLLEGCPWTESPYSALRGWSPPLLLPGPPAETRRLASRQQLPGLQRSWQMWETSLQFLFARLFGFLVSVQTFLLLHVHTTGSPPLSKSASVSVLSLSTFPFLPHLPFKLIALSLWCIFHIFKSPQMSQQ